MMSSSCDTQRTASFNAQQATDNLLHELQHAGPLAVAFSGGLDSRLLAFCAQKASVPLLLVHATGPHIQAEATEATQIWARTHNVPLLLIDTDPVAWPDITTNGNQRCYYCKKKLFSLFLEAVKEETQKCGTPYTLCDGTHAGDETTFRPGLKAIKELKVLSPLARCGLHKEQIRKLAYHLGVEQPEQPSKACLLTRFPYEATPSRQQLINMDAAEKVIETILAAHLPTPSKENPATFRLRCEAEKNPHIMHTSIRKASKYSCLIADLYVETPLTKSLTEIIHQQLPCGIQLDSVTFSKNVSGHFDK